MVRARLDPADFAGHSLRSGCATSAAPRRSAITWPRRRGCRLNAAAFQIDCEGSGRYSGFACFHYYL